MRLSPICGVETLPWHMCGRVSFLTDILGCFCMPPVENQEGFMFRSGDVLCRTNRQSAGSFFGQFIYNYKEYIRPL